jgi:hypothetical protein
VAGAAVVGSTLVAWQGSDRNWVDRRALGELGAFLGALSFVVVMGLWAGMPDVSRIFRTGLWITVMVWGALVFGTRGATAAASTLALIWVVRSRDGAVFFDLADQPLEPVWTLVIVLLVTITPLGFATILQRR